MFIGKQVFAHKIHCARFQYIQYPFTDPDNGWLSLCAAEPDIRASRTVLSNTAAF
jgi:hypothetical protein